MMTDPQKPETTGTGRKWKIGGLATLVTVVCTVLTLMVAPGVREALCRSVADWPTPLPFFCGDEYVRVDQVQAEKFLMRFYGRASGADPRRAYELLADAERQRVPVEAFAHRWEDRAWAELAGIEPTGDGRFNSYRVLVRHYEGRETGGMLTSGAVVVRSSEVTLLKTGGAILLAHESEPQRHEIDLDHRYPRVELVRKHGTYLEASTDSQPAVFAEELTVGGQLNVLCILSPPDQAQVPPFVTEDWIRTPQGGSPLPSSPPRMGPRPPAIPAMGLSGSNPPRPSPALGPTIAGEGLCRPTSRGTVRGQCAWARAPGSSARVRHREAVRCDFSGRDPFVAVGCCVRRPPRECSRRAVVDSPLTPRPRSAGTPGPQPCRCARGGI
jgi:hypothetical protein